MKNQVIGYVYCENCGKFHNSVKCATTGKEISEIDCKMCSVMCFGDHTKDIYDED